MRGDYTFTRKSQSNINLKKKAVFRNIKHPDILLHSLMSTNHDTAL